MMKILLIDSNKNDLIVNRDVLTAHGHQVDAVMSADEALKSSSSGDYDLALAEVNLADGSGLKLVESLARRMKLYILTEGISVARAIKAIKLNAMDVIFKPLDAAKIDQIERSVPEKSRRLKTTSRQRETENSIRPQRSMEK